MGDWVCGKCSKEYDTNEYLRLKKVQVVKGEKYPTAPNGHGFTSVCACGYVFGKDKWRKATVMKIPVGGGRNIQVRVSTVFLELKHDNWRGNGEYNLYETMIFRTDGKRFDDVGFGKRYRTKDEAKAGHKKVVDNLKGDYQITKKGESGYQICKEGDTYRINIVLEPDRS